MLVSEDNKVLSCRVLTYIGDISYSLYLIHWPIYAYWKLMANGNQLGLLLSRSTSHMMKHFRISPFSSGICPTSRSYLRNFREVVPSSLFHKHRDPGCHPFRIECFGDKQGRNQRTD